MKIAEQNIAAIQSFGYTESEARFSHVASHVPATLSPAVPCLHWRKVGQAIHALCREASRAADTLPGASTQA